MLKIGRNLSQWTARCTSDADKTRSLHEKEENKKSLRHWDFPGRRRRILIFLVPKGYLESRVLQAMGSVTSSESEESV